MLYFFCGDSMNKNDIKRVILGTGSYDNVLSGNTVSITGDGGNAWGYFGPAYKKMAPRLVTYTPYAEGYQELLKLREDITKVKEYLELRKKLEDDYIKSFYEIRLKDLDVFNLIAELEERFGEDIIFLCHEDIKEFCHRRLLADYIELKSGIYIPEVSVDKGGYVKMIQPIRYKNRLREVINNERRNN